jgi:hypothetical protein
MIQYYNQTSIILSKDINVTRVFMLYENKRMKPVEIILRMGRRGKEGE